MMPEGEYMPASSQDMSAGSSEAMPMGTEVKAKPCDGSCDTSAGQDNKNVIMIATNAGGTEPTVTMNEPIQPPAATHTVRSYSLSS